MNPEGCVRRVCEKRLGRDGLRVLESKPTEGSRVRPLSGPTSPVRGHRAVSVASVCVPGAVTQRIPLNAAKDNSQATVSLQGQPSTATRSVRAAHRA